MKLLILTLLCSGAWGWTKTYEGYTAVEVTPTEKSQVDALLTLGDEEVIVISPPVLNHNVRLLISEERMGMMKALFEKNGLKYTDTGINVAAKLSEEWDKLQQREKVYDPAIFNTLEDIHSQIDVMAAECADHGLTCNVVTMAGATHEGREMKALQISTGTFGAKPIWWVDSCIHCREWLACATTMNIFTNLINEADIGGSEAQLFLAQVDFTFIPVMNPDGYVFTFTDDRYWRKNRRNNEAALCFGVDLNRNWDQNWSGPGASNQPCSDTYYGPSAGSEPETQAAVNYFSSLPRVPEAFFSVHTYGYYLLTPWGTGVLPVDDCTNACNLACTAIENTHGTTWSCGNSAQVLYETSGGSIDWAYERGSVYSYTPELRGADFDVPPIQITPSVEELWNGFIAVRNYISRP